MATLTNTAITKAITRKYFKRQGKRVKQICVGENLWGELIDSGKLAWRYRFNRFWHTCRFAVCSSTAGSMLAACPLL